MAAEPERVSVRQQQGTLEHVRWVLLDDRVRGMWRNLVISVFSRDKPVFRSSPYYRLKPDIR